VLQVQAFDVTDLLVPGSNALGAVLSDGWFRGQTGADRRTAVYGDTVALLAQLHVLDATGATIRAGTDEHWVASTGAITAADLIQGQAVDLRLGASSCCQPGSTTGDWRPVAVRDHSLTTLCSSPSPPVPPGTVADISLPDGSTRVAEPGSQTYTCQL
jgi:alpha-L-rhamnosidase